MARVLALATATMIGLVPVAEARTLNWSGHAWHVRASNGLAGPGPNVFSDSAKSVWVDPAGRLHMKVRREGRRWVSAEIFTQQPLGPGRYTWVTEVPAVLDANVTVGMFTYLDDEHEYDVELAKWGNPGDPNNAQYAVQPAGDPGNLMRFAVPPGAQTFSYDWRASALTFGNGWVYTGPNLWLGSAPVHINVWQFQGRAPASGREVEIVFRSFSWAP